MQLLTNVLPALLATILVVLVPGAALLALSRLDRVVPPPLLPAAALALGLAPLAIATGVALALRLPVEYVAGFEALLLLSAWSQLARRVRSTASADQSFSRARVGRAQAWATPIRWLVAGEWVRAVPRGALAAALASAALAFISGYFAWNDSLYHMGQAQKLLALDHPTFSNTLQFPDGTAHPGYLLPAWHEAIALVAYVARVDVVVAAWVMPIVTLPVATLAMAGLGWAVFRVRAAATVTAVAWLLASVVSTLPSSELLFNALHPGHIAIEILAPLVVAMLVTALWPARRESTQDGFDLAGTPHSMVSRAATFIAVLAVAEVAVLHVSYLMVLALGMLGYLAVWALRSPWSRADVAGHARVFVSIAVVAVIGVAILFPGLTDLDNLGRDASTELAANDSDLFEGKLGANLDAVLRGNPSGAYHLRADYLVLFGGMSLAGLLSVVLVLWAPRWPGGWYIAGTTCIVLVIALLGQVFPHYVKITSLDQARRIERALPLALGLAAGTLAASAGAAHLWGRRHFGRAGAVATIAAATALLYLAADRVPFLAGYGGSQIIEPRVITAVLGALLIGAVLMVALLLLRLVRGRAAAARGEGLLRMHTWEWPTDLITPAVGILATAMLLVGAIPLYGAVGDAAEASRIDKLPLNQRAGEMRFFSTGVARELRRLPVSATVLGDPRNRDIYTAMAIAPVYVVSSVPRHTASTPGNRVRERFDTAAAFFSEKDAQGRPMTDTRRIRVLLDNKVDAVIIHPKGFRPAIDLLLRTPGITKVARGTNQFMFRVDRAKLRTAAPRAAR